MHGFGSFCACAKYHTDLSAAFMRSVVSSSGQRRPISDCAGAQADMGLRCPHMREEDTFSQSAVHIMLYIVFPVILGRQRWRNGLLRRQWSFSPSRFIKLGPLT